MWVKKYDWIKLKSEFFEKERPSVREFIKQVLGEDTANNHRIWEQTKWRAEEKKELREKIQQKAMENMEKKLVKKYEPSVEELNEMLRFIIQIAKKKLNVLAKAEDPDTKQLRDVYWMVKTERKEPSTISKNENIEKIDDSNPLDWVLEKLQEEWKLNIENVDELEELKTDNLEN